MSDTVTGSIYQAPDGGTAQLEGVTNTGTVFGSQNNNGFIATSGGTVTLVDLPGTTYTDILGLNASGTAGFGEATVSGRATSFVDNNGTLTPLLAGDTPIGVDDAGEVLVQGPETEGGAQTSFLLKDGVVEPVALPTPDSVATAISLGGVIAGLAGPAGTQSYFVDTPGATTTYAYPFTYDGATYLTAGAPTAVNNAGEVAVASQGSGDAVLVQDGAIVASFQDPHGQPTVIALNNEGEGVVSDFNENSRGIVPVVSASGTTDILVTATSYPVPGGINDAGEVAGSALVEGDPADTSTYSVVGFTAELPCFVAGTLVATERGEMPVEAIRTGDLVRTADGDLRPVTWTGARVVALARHPDPALARPVVIRAGAFGPGLPRRNLAVSPDHAIAWADVLIPAKCLVDGERVVTDAGADTVSYHHLELAEHDLLLAEGLAVESFLDTGNRLALAGGAGDADLSTAPDCAFFEWEARGCRRLVLAGPELDAARAALAVLPA